jgi:two-component system, NarL family, sensor kinase
MSQELTVIFLVVFCLIILLGFVSFIVYIVFLHQRSRNKFMLEMEVMKQNFQNEILKSELEMQEQTLANISMEIHDNVSQVLSVSKLNLGIIEEASPESINKIRYSVDLMTNAMQDLSKLSRRLDADLIRQEGFYVAVEEYINRLRRSVQGVVVFNAHGQTESVPPEKELVLFRILQEAVNNILKHAEASLIVINLVISEKELALEITDNGRGFSIEEFSLRGLQGAGIKSMQKRTSMMNGLFTMDSASGRGSRIRIQVPISQN